MKTADSSTDGTGEACVTTLMQQWAANIELKQRSAGTVWNGSWHVRESNSDWNLDLHRQDSPRCVKLGWTFTVNGRVLRSIVEQYHQIVQVYTVLVWKWHHTWTGWWRRLLACWSPSVSTLSIEVETLRFSCKIYWWSQSQVWSSALSTALQ